MRIMTILLLNMVILRSSIGHAHNGLESLQKYRLESLVNKIKPQICILLITLQQVEYMVK